MELRVAAQTQQAHYQASLDQANAQHQVELAFEMLKAYQQKSTLFGQNCCPKPPSSLLEWPFKINSRR